MECNLFLSLMNWFSNCPRSWLLCPFDRSLSWEHVLVFWHHSMFQAYHYTSGTSLLDSNFRHSLSMFLEGKKKRAFRNQDLSAEFVQWLLAVYFYAYLLFCNPWVQRCPQFQSNTTKFILDFSLLRLVTLFPNDENPASQYSIFMCLLNPASCKCLPVLLCHWPTQPPSFLRPQLPGRWSAGPLTLFEPWLLLGHPRTRLSSSPEPAQSLVGGLLGNGAKKERGEPNEYFI